MGFFGSCIVELTDIFFTTDVDQFLPKYYPHAMGQLIIEPNDDIRNQGTRIMKNKANWDSFVLTGQIVSPLSIEYATQQTLGLTHTNPNTQTINGYTLFSVMYDSAKPKFSGTPRNIPLNAVIYVTKQSSNPVLWTNAVVIDCFIDPDGHIKINTQCYLIKAPTAITWHNTLADLNKQLGLQAQKNMVFLLCRLSLTK
ncbi:MAG: hypothetical protein EZS28_017988 [Streblomastix strix]|uniref:Uncharacterized protein n=1 Tax=Streblomastix strix TaxID=222440 RepID=A0A5J4VVC3_9EUKA|nr:MAG: hypothetical protein EZS28_017988 [Streblomastix strix]